MDMLGHTYGTLGYLSLYFTFGWLCYDTADSTWAIPGSFVEKSYTHLNNRLEIIMRGHTLSTSQ